MSSLTHSSGGSLTFTHNAAGLIASVTESDGDTTTYQYDVANEHLVSVTDVNGVTQFEYSTGSSLAQAHALVSATPPEGPARAMESTLWAV